MKRRGTLSWIAIVAVACLTLSCCSGLRRDEPLATHGPKDADADAVACGSEEPSCDVPPKPVGYSDSLDINSGEIRHQEYSSDGSAKTTISESRLSKEIRRLGIGIPAQRHWQFLGGKQGGMYVDGVYGFVPGLADNLLQLLDDSSTPDGERRAILTEFMASLRTGDGRLARQQAYNLLVEVRNRKGFTEGTP